MWTRWGLNLRPPDYESVRSICKTDGLQLGLHENQMGGGAGAGEKAFTDKGIQLGRGVVTGEAGELHVGRGADVAALVEVAHQ